MNILRKSIKKKIVLYILIAIVLGSLNISGYSGEGEQTKGPLISNNIYPFYLPFINLQPERAMNLGLGNFKFSVSCNYGNSFNWDRDGLDDGFQFDLDIENSRITFAADIGVTDFLDVGIEANYNILYGGFADSIIQGFHDLFGLANAGRQLTENNQFNITIKNNHGTWVEMTEPVYGIGDITVKGKIKLYADEQSNTYLSLQPAVKIPMGDADYLLSSGGLDLALNLLAEKSGLNYGAYINIGWLHLTQPENLTIFGFKEDLFSFMLSYEWLVNGGWSFYIQTDGNTSPYKSSHKRLDHFTASINIGFKVELAEGTLLQASFGEEFFTFATTDISILVALIFEFD